MEGIFPYLKELSQETKSKILLIVLDGVGGLPKIPGGPTELAAAKTPNLDALAKESALGLLTPVYPGIAPGSGPGHLALFGYDPFEYQVGRGILSAIGIGVPLNQGDVAVRGNFATLASDNTVQDRRANRPSTKENNRVVNKLAAAIQRIGEVKIDLYTESEHRFVVVLRGQDLGEAVSDTDPQAIGVPPLSAAPREAGDASSSKTAEVLNIFSERARQVLSDEPVINGVLLRGVSARPDFPQMQQVLKLNPAAIASYPMYRGVASLVGMKTLPVEGEEDALEGKIQALKAYWPEHDFIYLHFKKTDSTGEDGSFAEKAHKIELFDALLPDILSFGPDVLAITGDHSTPSVHKAHSWHPVPLLLAGPLLRNDPATRFTEDEALKGSLGRLRGIEMMPMLLAYAGKLQKYGA